MSLLFLVVLVSLVEMISGGYCNCTQKIYKSSNCTGNATSTIKVTASGACFSTGTSFAHLVGASQVANRVDTCEAATIGGNYYINTDCAGSPTEFSYPVGQCTKGSLSNGSTTTTFYVKIGCVANPNSASGLRFSSTLLMLCLALLALVKA